MHAPIRRSRGIPLIGRLALGAGVLAVAVLVLYVGAGGLSVVAGALGGDDHELRAGRDGDPGPVGPRADRPEAPTIESPTEPYTNQAQADLTVTVPSRIAGNPDYLVRVYLALKDQAPTPIDEKPLAPTAQMIIPVTLTNGINDFSVTLVGSGRRVRVVAARPLGARHGSAGHPPRLPEGRRDWSTARPSRSKVARRAGRRSTLGTRRRATRSAARPQVTGRSR